MEIRFDINYWNLDGLKLYAEIKPDGAIITFPISKIHGPTRRIACIYSKFLKASLILLLRGEGRVLQSINSITGNEFELKLGKNRTIVDITTVEPHLYLLDEQQQEIVRLEVGPKEFHHSENWVVKLGEVSSSTRMAIVGSQSEGFIAYICSGGESRILAVALDKKRDTREVKIKISSGQQTLGAEIHLCADPKKNTLLVSDTMNHRILEVDCTTGQAEVLSGTNTPGQAGERQIANEAKLHSPRGIGIYRHGELIRNIGFDTTSEIIIKLNPRTILVADSNNFCVKKIINFPLLATEMFYWPSSPLLYTLIGTGRELQSKGKYPDLDKFQREDLRKYCIPKPIDIVITKLGEVVICFEGFNPLVLLRPATVSGEIVSYSINRTYGVDRS